MDYCKLYRERYLPRKEVNLAKGAKVTWLEKPHDRYMKLGETALTDGLFGGSSFVESWVGWEGTDGAFVLDMGEVKEVRSIETDFLHQIGQWILFPLSVSYSYSTDGKEYHLWKTIDMPEERSGMVLFQRCKSRFGSTFAGSLSESRGYRNKGMSSLALRSRTSFLVLYR